jgi:uncharacterized protein
VTLDELRRFAVARSLFPPAALQRALDTLAFVQADPIRAPARAQDLTLRHRVKGYRAGDLERLYGRLDVHEDFFVNYGFVTSALQALMHPRGGPAPWSASRGRHVRAMLDFVRRHEAVHPRDVDAHFSHGTVTNYWGGSSSATTHLLESMHYDGFLRVVRRDAGIRIYAAAERVAPPADRATRQAQIDRLVDRLVSAYAPVPAKALSVLVRRLRYGVPQWRRELPAAIQRARHRSSHARVDGLDWYWPAGERVAVQEDDAVRLLAPFDPIVWDRDRFELFWGWAYRFEAYTPAAKRKLGYYALPLLWRDRVIGWGNVSVRGGDLHAHIDFIAGAPARDRAFTHALDLELDRMRAFLALDADAGVQRGEVIGRRSTVDGPQSTVEPLNPDRRPSTTGRGVHRPRHSVDRRP